MHVYVFGSGLVLALVLGSTTAAAASSRLPAPLNWPLERDNGPSFTWHQFEGEREREKEGKKFSRELHKSWKLLDVEIAQLIPALALSLSLSFTISSTVS